MKIDNRYDLLQYIESLLYTIPDIVYVLLIAVFCLLTITVVIKNHNYEKRLVNICRLLFFEYLSFIFCITIVFRDYVETRPMELQLFWSYADAKSGNTYLYYENILNICLFIPIGFLFYYSWPQLKWWCTLLFGTIISVTIEVMQLCFRRGLCEIDDVFHNIIGCLEGILIAITLKAIVRCLKLQKKVDIHPPKTGISVHFSD